MRRSESQRSIFSRRVPRLAATGIAIVLAQPLAGCFLRNENIPAAIEMPPAYRAGPRHADAALPSVVWWRGFGSKELTALIEESLTSNFDVAAAVARIVQADANSRDRRRGAAADRRSQRQRDASRASQSSGGGGQFHGVVAAAAGRRTRDLQHVAQRQLRDRLLGQEPRRAARRRRACRRQPVRSRGRGADHRRQRGQFLFPGARSAGSPSHRARQPGRRHARLQPDQAALRRRHRLRARHRAAGKPGQHPARLDPAAGADLAAEHGDARGADRPHAGVRGHSRRQHVAAAHSAGDARACRPI